MADKSADEKLFESLDKKHPSYEAWADEWQNYRDVVGDDLVDKERYLPKNKFEPDGQYDFRVKMSEFIPESGIPLGRIVGALYREKPKRELGGQEAELKDFLDRSTRRGLTWNALVEQLATRLLTYGTLRTLVNVPMTPDIGDNPPPLSRKDEQDLNIRPFVVDYSPLSVTDWDHDEEGELLFVRVKECRVVRVGSGIDAVHVDEVKFLDYTRDAVNWWVFHTNQDAQAKRRLVKLGNSVHGLGVVPMVMYDLKPIRPGIGNSFIRYSALADILKFRSESDIGYDAYLHAHPFLAIWTEDDLKEVGVGATTFLKLNPGSEGTGREDAKYVEAPSSAFDALQSRIADARSQIFRQTKVDPMGVVSGGNTQNASSVFQASGAARAWSFGTTEARVLSAIADEMEQVERRVLDLVLRWQGEAPKGSEEMAFTGSIQYPEEFDLASTEQLIDERAKIAATVNSPTLLRIIDKRIAASKVGDVTTEEMKKINDEIDKNPLMGTLAGKTGDAFAMPAMPGAPGLPKPAAPKPAVPKAGPAKQATAGAQR